MAVNSDRRRCDQWGRDTSYAVLGEPDVTLSRLERGLGKRTRITCRQSAWDHLQARSPLKTDDALLSEAKELALLEYRVKEFANLPVEQLHIHATWRRTMSAWMFISRKSARAQPTDRGLLPL